MCIFASAIDRVRRTQLLYTQVQPVPTGSHPGGSERYAIQSYANEVGLSQGKPTAMILPVPCKAEDIYLLNKENDTSAQRVFQALHDQFEAEKPRVMTFSLGSTMSYGGDARSAPLAVIQSGSYEVSIVPSFEDLGRLDRAVFPAQDPQLLDALRRSSNESTAYLVFVLRQSAPYQPFVYMYRLTDGQSKGFVPTKHYHPHPLPQPPHWSAQWNDETRHAWMATEARKITDRVTREAQVASDWDHEILVLGVDGFSPPGWPATALRHTQDLAFKVAPLLALAPFPVQLVAHTAHRIQRVGTHANLDLEFDLVPLVHGGAFCNACRQVLRQGHRYKCLACDDLDLCQACHRSGQAMTGDPLHDGQPGHPLLEIKSKEDAAVVVNLIQGSIKAARILRVEDQVTHALDKACNDIALAFARAKHAQSFGQQQAAPMFPSAGIDPSGLFFPGGAPRSS